MLRILQLDERSHIIYGEEARVLILTHQTCLPAFFEYE